MTKNTKEWIVAFPLAMLGVGVVYGGSLALLYWLPRQVWFAKLITG